VSGADDTGLRTRQRQLRRARRHLGVGEFGGGGRGRQLGALAPSATVRNGRRGPADETSAAVLPILIVRPASAECGQMTPAKSGFVFSVNLRTSPVFRSITISPAWIKTRFPLASRSANTSATVITHERCGDPGSVDWEPDRGVPRRSFHMRRWRSGLADLNRPSGRSARGRQGRIQSVDDSPHSASRPSKRSRPSRETTPPGSSQA
jgi:hypothetical protein